MSTDIYSQVNFTAGQEVRAQDLKDISNFINAKINDQKMYWSLFSKYDSLADYAVFGTAETDAIERFAYVLDPQQAHFRRGAEPNRVYMSPGTIYQVVGGVPDGDEQKVLPYTFDGTEFVTIASGSGTFARVDVIQMKLELIDDDEQSRVFKTEPAFASLDLDTLTTNIDTVVVARVPGTAGNNIRVEFAKRTSGSGVTVTETQYTVLVEYEDGVSTVLDIETEIDDESTLIEVLTPGTAANVAVDPDDTFADTALAGGVQSVLTSQDLDMKRRVQCTISVVTGTAAASPNIPDPTSGYVMIAAVYIPSGHVASATPGDDKYWYINDPGATYTELTTGGAIAALRCCLMDHRMPLGIRPYTVYPGEFFYQDNGSNWSLLSSRRQLVQLDATPDGTTRTWVPCPHKLSGRLIAIVAMVDDASAAYDLTSMVFLTIDPWYPGVGDMTDGYKSNLVQLLNSPGRSANMIGSENSDTSFEMNHDVSDWPAVLGEALAVVNGNNNSQGVPMWTSGLRAPGFNEVGVQAGRELLSDFDGFQLLLMYDGTVPENVRLGPVTFWVATGVL